MSLTNDDHGFHRTAQAMPTALAPAVRPAVKPLTSYRPFWAKRFGPAPFLPMSRDEMTQVGWHSCDVIIVTGDA